MSNNGLVIPPLRWRDYVLLRGEGLRSFWSQHLGATERNVLVIMGKGFDPRACLGARTLAEAGGSGRRDVIVLDFAEGESHGTSSHTAFTEANWSSLQETLAGRWTISVRPILLRRTDGRRTGSQNAANLFNSLDQIADYTDIIVDVSAMPRVVFFPLTARLLHLLDQDAARANRNLHVLTAEDPDLDARIRVEGIDETANFLHSFEGRFMREATGQHPKVWIPLLGEARTTQFDRIYDHVKPDEVCPVVPSPSRSPRRGDDIVMEYRDLLFDQLRIDPRNIIYASEQNPFEVYRQVRRAALHYHHVFRLLGGCKIALSPLSSKLMSLGALLVAYEMKPTLDVGVAHIECQSYVLESREMNPELVGLWLSGACYET
jgi:hypothetical protein